MRVVLLFAEGLAAETAGGDGHELVQGDKF